MALPEAWSPFRELARIRRRFDELLEDMMGERETVFEEFEPMLKPRLESFIEDGKLIVRADMPGIDPKNIEVSVTGSELRIHGEREEKKETKKRDFFHREVRYGSYDRVLTLPEGVKAEELKATYRDGVLELTAPVPKELARKEIKVAVEGGETKKIETKEGQKAA
jgi:HSP20 family protein